MQHERKDSHTFMYTLSCTECPCFDGGYCDHKWKKCRCPPGRTGEYCQSRCNPGFYGIECVQLCTCAETASCDDVNGLCSCPEENKE